jgi:hypothetical protein
MPDFILHDENGWSIPNETTQGENFAEKWNKNPDLAFAFFEWHRACIDELERLLELVGRDQIHKHLEESFGQQPVAKAMQRITERVSASRSSGRLAVVPGLGLNSVGAARATLVRPNTFFGEP